MSASLLDGRCTSCTPYSVPGSYAVLPFPILVSPARHESADSQPSLYGLHYLRRQTLTFEQVCSLQGEAEELLADSEFEVSSESVLELVRDSDCSVYDCEFIALAVKLDTKLITMDKKLLKAFPKRAVALTAG